MEPMPLVQMESVEMVALVFLMILVDQVYITLVWRGGRWSRTGIGW